MPFIESNPTFGKHVKRWHECHTGHCLRWLDSGLPAASEDKEEMFLSTPTLMHPDILASQDPSIQWSEVLGPQDPRVPGDLGSWDPGNSRSWIPEGPRILDSWILGCLDHGAP